MLFNGTGSTTYVMASNGIITKYFKSGIENEIKRKNETKGIK
jgi:hypothetical protein